MEKSKYYVVRDKALPEVLQKVAEAKQLLDKNRSMTCLLYTSWGSASAMISVSPSWPGAWSWTGHG